MSKKKGAISAFPELIMIIFALALGFMLFAIASKYGPAVRTQTEGSIEGEPYLVAERLAEFAEDCWKRNNRGNSKDSDVCFTVTVNSSGNVTEGLFNRYLDCESLPNNYLNIEDRPYDRCGRSDNVYWELFMKDTEVKISYSAERRRIEIVETEALCTGECCIAKCNERCNDLRNKCDEMHDKCSGAICDEFYDDCKKTLDSPVDGVCANCRENCNV